MMSHTPGPWSVPHFATAKDENDCECTYVLSEGYMGAVCSVHIDNGKSFVAGGNDCPPAEEAKANARLIAAAPDLLNALEWAMRQMEKPNSTFTKSYWERYALAAEAIEKATGA